MKPNTSFAVTHTAYDLGFIGCDSNSTDSMPTNTDTPNQATLEMTPNGGAQEEPVIRRSRSHLAKTHQPLSQL